MFTTQTATDQFRRFPKNTWRLMILRERYMGLLANNECIVSKDASNKAVESQRTDPSTNMGILVRNTASRPSNSMTL